jgi:hypothetical protein
VVFMHVSWVQAAITVMDPTFLICVAGRFVCLLPCAIGVCRRAVGDGQLWGVGGIAGRVFDRTVCPGSSESGRYQNLSWISWAVTRYKLSTSTALKAALHPQRKYVTKCLHRDRTRPVVV